MRRLTMARVGAAGLGSAALILLMLVGVSGGPAGAVRRLFAPKPAEKHVRALRVPRVSASPSQGRVSLRPRTSLEGDEVSPALATYSIDRDGNLYEVHSPHTEELRLPLPTT